MVRVKKTEGHQENTFIGFIENFSDLTFSFLDKILRKILSICTQNKLDYFQTTKQETKI
jgi:hypothetical protein